VTYCSSGRRPSVHSVGHSYILPGGLCAVPAGPLRGAARDSGESGGHARLLWCLLLVGLPIGLWAASLYTASQGWVAVLPSWINPGRNGCQQIGHAGAEWSLTRPDRSMLVRRAAAAATGALAAVGRMALTNYLFQTLVCTTLF